MMWLVEVPQCVVAAHLEMLPKLQAEESLDQAAVVAIGRVMKRGAWTTRQLSAWKKAAEGSRRRISSRRAEPSDLQALGIGVRRVKRDG